MDAGDEGGSESGGPQGRAAGGSLGRAPVIVTHDGTFHADEVLAVSMLRLLPAYAGATLVRTRDDAALAAADVVVDVGCVYDPDARRYDHHQPGFHATLVTPSSVRATPLSSAGLVYQHHGADVIAAVVAAAGDLPVLSSPDAAAVFERVYTTFVEAIDAVDNGVVQFISAPCPTCEPHRKGGGGGRGGGDRGAGGSGAGGSGAGGRRRGQVSKGRGAGAHRPAMALYQVTTSLQGRIARLNGRWGEDAVAAANVAGSQDLQFAAAATLASTEFVNAVMDAVTSWLPARTVVESAMATRWEVHASGRVLLLPQWVPWQPHLVPSEEAAGAAGAILYVVYTDGRGWDTEWRVRAVGDLFFRLRKRLPRAWCGLRGAALDAVVGVEGCAFVHGSGCLGHHANREGALAMARRAVDA